MLSCEEGPLKIVMLGDARVGKTSVTLRYCTDLFDGKQESTKDATYLEKSVKLDDGRTAVMAIWDTAGQEQFNAMMPMYYRDALGAVLVYDVTKKESFTRVLFIPLWKVEKWVEQLKKFAGENIEIVIAGNKSDMKNDVQVSQQDADAYAQSQGAKHFLTSAKCNMGIDAMFLYMAKQIVNKSQSKEKKKKTYVIKDSKQNQQNQSSSCC